ncbi:hypothetical protein [Caulobacter sp. 17J65-9]|uniref:hypothetical protein n=1 Tax=Caulobacter sp. 17J65-9 TaxID=2709382 RepID=UPI0013CA8FF2|nr:hypothetical protein [Caulobacter sp. 17J65-9]NEX93204.1 hypothetical protein [Caulobacter sp. 17J65-9]
MKLGLALAAAATGLFAAEAAWAGPCYDLAKGQPRELTGTLDYVVYPGPPNYEDVRAGDTPEPSYVLRLTRPICLTGDEFANEDQTFSAVQLVATQAVPGQTLKAYLHRQVTVVFGDRMAATTGHHHEPLVAWAASVAPTARPMEFTEEYGTAATTVRAFYAALSDGQGAAAAAMVVPEKRAGGPFSAAELTRFYGGLKEPIRLVDIAQSGPAEFVAHYRYATGKRVCDGRAVVRTVSRDGRNLIQSIRALDGC